MTLKGQRDALRDGKVLGWECTACAHRSITPILACPGCGSREPRAAEFSTQGRVVTYTIQSIAPEPFVNEVPFAWVVVELDGGPRVSGWIPYIQRPDDLRLGQRVRFLPGYKPGMQFEKLPESSPQGKQGESP